MSPRFVWPRTLGAWALLWGSVSGCTAADVEDAEGPACVLSQGRPGVSVTHFHGDARRLGAFDPSGRLGVATVAQTEFGPRWRSESFDTLEIDGVVYPPLIYATPLFVEGVEVDASRLEGPADLLFTATSNGWVYAVAAQGDDGCGVEPGAIIWRRKVVDATPIENLDQGVPMGVLSTPVIDAERGLLFVCGHDATQGWRVHAYRLDSGAPVAGWPVVVDDAALASVNTNGPARFHASETMSQRGALQMSPAGDRLYVAFGTYWGSGVGWLVAVDTVRPGVAAAFSSAPWTDASSSGGIWGSAGPAVDEDGRVWATTGNSPPDSADAVGVWGSSLLQFDADLNLERAYSPFNYCQLDAANMDLGASQPHLLSPLTGTSTPRTVAFGGKQGVVYLVDVETMPMASASRGPCGSDAARDRSLLPPQPQSHFGTRGPISVFGPYSDEFGEIDHAKMRTKLAEWNGLQGQRFLFAAGSSKASAASTDNAAPSVAKILVTSDGGDEPAYLQIDRVNEEVVMANPGSPIVSGGGEDAVVWILDRNAPRTAELLDAETPGPILFAFAADDLRLLWSSPPLGRGGKYSSPIVVGGSVVVATDRLEAFGPG